MSLPAETADFPATVDSIAADLANLGVKAGMVLLVHSSLKALGWVNGGAVAVIRALQAVLREQGTLVMPTHSADLSDPANWVNPPVPPSWWDTIRATMPAFEGDLTPTVGMGVIPETFRKGEGVLRSAHPSTSFAAWGKDAPEITENHVLTPSLGEGSPLARVYERDGWVLLLGVDHNRNTSLHLAEVRADIPRRVTHTGAPLLIDGVRQWVAYDDIDWDDADFVQIGVDFARETGLQVRGKVARADALFMPQQKLVDFAARWMETNRRGWENSGL
jgi:aminoglycoside 3-N-acetyltransferase